MRISVVIPYYNRKQKLINVLKSIGDVFEIIVVDDGSDKEHQIYDLDFPIRIIRLEKTGWRGPTIAYNAGFKAVEGDVILINSSECVHVGDIVGYVSDNFSMGDYMAFSALMGIKEGMDMDKCWWGVHSTIGNCIPYCAAISKENMDILGGYDERFVGGIGYDDYDFTHRVKNLKLKIKIVDNPFVFHQWHKPTEYPNTKNLDLLNSLNKNFPDRIKC